LSIERKELPSTKTTPDPGGISAETVSAFNTHLECGDESPHSRSFLRHDAERLRTRHDSFETNHRQPAHHSLRCSSTAGRVGIADVVKQATARPKHSKQLAVEVRRVQVAG